MDHSYLMAKQFIGSYCLWQLAESISSGRVLKKKYHLEWWDSEGVMEWSWMSGIPVAGASRSKELNDKEYYY